MGWARRTHIRIALASGVALAAVGCSLLTSFDGFGPPATTGPSCQLARWPEPPSKEDKAGDNTMVAAWNSIELGGLDAGAGAFGYDLDGLCTCPDRSACRSPVVDASPVCDDPGSGGRDNQFGFLVRQLIAFQAINDQGVNDNLRSGQYGVLLRVDHYNGGANDKQVTASLYDTVALREGGAPRQDGTDEWVLDTNSVDLGQFPAYKDDNAYVTNGVLVASLARFQLRISLPPTNQIIPFDLSGVHLTARLHVSGNQVDVDNGVLAGRVSLASLETAGGILGICPTGGTADLEKMVCGLEDLPSDPKNDGTNAVCDALSAAVAFTAVHALPPTTTADRDAGVSLCPNPGSPTCN